MNLPQFTKSERDRVAAVLSVIPGLGHIYKHHYLSGFGILIGGNLLMLFIAGWLSLATFGVSLLLVPALYWAAVIASAYYLEDWHGMHDYLHPWKKHH
ncbi:hypothetical protein SAMN02745181_3156 [Rubritalea squalenifaciens DSM 18772]|uniref:Uncharacterized protein n=1 Tax=Rubritalea squalenifaciens DSM 18772 TaxID=1123071 RepID=A0A1M6PDJ7_9BACT|nr:hypothetical protein [Rubritalea squalenifaciens]SHK06023.1 hypothetical protein SAMN02745181_3156 [Rubritalea squalenifaciens DSM 18772]